MKELNQLNFNDILHVDTDVDNYDFNVYMDNDEHILKGFCTRCEQAGYNTCLSDPTFRLQTMSHGATTKDILQATGENVVPADWKKEGVIFLMEGPSVDWGFYQQVEYNGIKKKPTREWYWVHDKQQAFHYPQEFVGARYGTLFNSIIHTFKLGNAYLTNLVKCGLNNDSNRYKGIADYNWKCLETCVDNILMKEIQLINPKVIFIFGSKVQDFLWDLTYPGQDYPFLAVGLPHPARAQAGFKNEYYRHLYFTRVLEGLYKANIYTLDEATDKFREFLSAR